MPSPVPTYPKIYHIVHFDKLSSIFLKGGLLCDAEIICTPQQGTTIGMGKIKQRRLNISLSCYPELHVGDCVPFYFCPRSVMLYMLYMANHEEVDYHGGQEPIIHLQSDLMQTISWANKNHRRWVFTDSNAGSYYFNAYDNLSQLSNIDWNAVNALNWVECRDKKQAEFLIEANFPWELVEYIGVYSEAQAGEVKEILNKVTRRPPVQTRRDWYY